MTLARDPARTAPDASAKAAEDARDRARARLLFVVNEAGYFLSHRGAIARAAAAAGWDVHVAVPESDRRGEIEALGVEMHAVPMSRAGLHPLDNLRSLLALQALCRRLRPDVVHTIALKAVFLGGAAARIAGVRKRVFAVAGLGHIDTRRDVGALAMRAGLRTLLPWLVGRDGRLIVQNEADLARASATAALARRALLIPGSGVDLEAFRPAPEPDGPVTVVLPARMIWQKGVGDFVEAARILRARGEAVRMCLAGDSDPGNPGAIPPSTLRAWHGEGAVAWLGHCADMPRVLAEAHIVCLPSYYGEGVPKSLLEAAAAGRPVVTTDTPGCRAAVAPAESGVLVPPRAPAALADALARLAGDAAGRRRLGAAGRRLAESRFALPAVIDQHLSLYDEVRG